MVYRMLTYAQTSLELDTSGSILSHLDNIKTIIQQLSTPISLKNSGICVTT